VVPYKLGRDGHVGPERRGRDSERDPEKADELFHPQLLSPHFDGMAITLSKHRHSQATSAIAILDGETIAASAH
jgi:hypothetical protein